MAEVAIGQLRNRSHPSLFTGLIYWLSPWAGRMVTEPQGNTHLNWRQLGRICA